MKRSVLISLLVCAASVAHANIQTTDAVKAILGEGANQPYQAKLGIASAIRNRGSLQGVYGVNNGVWRHCAKNVRQQAVRAWDESARHDITHGCKFFGCPGDASYFAHLHFHAVLKIGDITFYKP